MSVALSLSVLFSCIFIFKKKEEIGWISKKKSRSHIADSLLVDTGFKKAENPLSGNCFENPYLFENIQGEIKSA